MLSVTTDRTQGGASLADGALELMVHRRLGTDDRRGVGEPLAEPGLDATGSGLVVRGVHRLALDDGAGAAAAGVEAVQAMLFPPHLMYSARGGARGAYSGLAAPLPPSVHLLTVQALGPHALLLRLAHLFEAGADAALSAPVTLQLSGLFQGTVLSGCTEVRARPGAARAPSVISLSLSLSLSRTARHTRTAHRTRTHALAHAHAPAPAR